MTNSIELEIAIMKAKITKQEIAKRLGISYMALKNKIDNKSEFKASEIQKLTKMLKLTNANDIFFANESDLKSL